MTLNLFKKIIPYPSLESELKAKEDDFSTRVPYIIDSEEHIPTTSREFYQDFGPIRHQATNEIIDDLAPYQHEIYDCPALTVLVDKCQKSGVTTWELAHDFQETIVNGRGKDCLVVGQTQQHAYEHIYTLKRMIADSEKYRKYMITNSRELFFREEQTKMSVIYLKNPDNPFRPSRIIGLPFRQQALWSWKNVFRVHISDPAIAPILNDAGVFAAAKGRLANTNGRMLIEGPPNGPNGKFYEWYEQYKDNSDPAFQVFTVIDEDAIEADVISREFLEQQKRELGPLYPQYYQGSFLLGVGNLFTDAMIQVCLELGEKYNLQNVPINKYAAHIGGIDPESRAAIVVCELDRDNDLARIVVAKQFDRTIAPSELASEVHRLHQGTPENDFEDAIPYLYWYVDGNHRSYVNELKRIFNEPQDWTRTDEFSDDIKIVPVNFGTEHRNILTHLWNVVDNGMLAIDENLGVCSDLVKAMRTAKHNGFSLDKQQTINSDLIDALRLSTKGLKIE